MQPQRQQFDQLFNQIWQGFVANLGALQLFCQEVSKHADELDRSRIHELSKEMADIFADDPIQVEQELLEFTPFLEDLEIYPDFRQHPKAAEALKLFRDSKFNSHMLEWSKENPQKAYKFAEVFASYLAHPPISGILLRRSAFILLIGFLEQLFENLLYVYYYLNNLDEDLNNNVQEDKARQKARKANSPRDGWPGRIKLFQKLIVDLGEAQAYQGELIEITQRRNLMVHKEGVIDTSYIRNVPEEYLPDGAEEGKILIISTHYLYRAFHLVSVFAFAINQACWRQWEYLNSHKKKANKAMDLFIYRELREGRFELVVDLVKISKQFPLPSLYKQSIRVNQAIAFSKLGKISEMWDVLSELPGKGLEWWGDVAQAIFRKDYIRVNFLLVQAKKNNKIKDVSPYWPLFDDVRDLPWFMPMFEHPNRGELQRKR